MLRRHCNMYKNPMLVFLLNFCRENIHTVNKLSNIPNGIQLYFRSLKHENINPKRFIPTIDIYPLICHLLDLKCEKRDGSFRRMKTFLNKAYSQIYYMKNLCVPIIRFIFTYIPHRKGYFRSPKDNKKPRSHYNYLINCKKLELINIERGTVIYFRSPLATKGFNKENR
ncbi:hypothetical protein BpHYR1_049780 [Brachionus plicatilis]|uniref:Uncharacterized protein n=1 Tax=Brachionus plicatilis TaxID=10195 RepID=A0A3M7PJ86_BRAPC|nr:hypothetical protein BpHYR1_049780 [Brachionus plicatilis]